MTFAAEMNGFGPGRRQDGGGPDGGRYDGGRYDGGRYDGSRHGGRYYGREGRCGRGLWWIAAMVLGFIWFWPVGLAVLGFAAISGRLRGDWRHEMRGHWQAMSGGGGSCGWGRRGGGRASAPSGNQAFDDYRTETLRRLEDEQREFVDYLERLRRAKDKAEFDQFMAERRGGPRPPTTSEQV